MSNEPAILIVDELTGELDTKMGMEVIQLLYDLNREINQTVLMVTHDPAVGALAERTLRMRDGKIIEIISYYFFLTFFYFYNLNRTSFISLF